MKINHDIIRKSSLGKTVHRIKSQRSILGYFKNRFEWHWYPRLSITKPYPIHIDIELSSKCQLKCPMCFRQHRKVENNDDMAFDLFKKIIDEIEGKVYSIKFTGRGEPLMNKNFTVFIDYLKNRSFGEIAMITNGLLMTEDIMECLIDNRMDFVSFSIDGLQDQYEEIRKPGRYEDILSVVKSLHDMKNKNNRAQPLIRIQSVKMQPEEEADYLNTWEPISDDIFFLHFKDYSVQAENEQMESYTCPLVFQRMMIHYDGTVPMCINDEYEDSIMGDLKTQSVYEIWNGDRFTETRQIQKNGIRTRKYLNCSKCALTREGHGN